MINSLPKRFSDKVDFSGDCWLWTAATRTGYGRYKSKGKMVQAHRFSWECFNGEIPSGFYILHKCDNPPCVRPDHHFLGTQSDNMTDMIKKGRGNRKSGEAARNAKLTQAQVDEIRKTCRLGNRWHKSDFTIQMLAKKYHISEAQVSNIVNFQRWISKELLVDASKNIHCH